MKVKIISILILLIIGHGLNAQRGQGGQKGNKRGKKMPSITVSGKVIDSASDLPLEFATVSLFAYRNDRLMGGGVSDVHGQFIFEARGKNVYVVIEYIGFDPYRMDSISMQNIDGELDLGTITLSQSGIALEGIEIRAEKSETQFSLDKKVFNVGKDLANRGGTAEDILDNVPSVSVDIDGNVSLRGSGGVRILVDGKPSGLVGLGNSNGLKSIPSNMIEKVEVITNPSARYEAEGMAGIINIVLKKNQGQGFNGAFDITGGFPLLYGSGANVNYRKGNLNWFANYGLRYREGPGGGFTYRETTRNDSLFILDQASDRNRTGLSNSIRFGADYFLNKKEQLTLAFLYRASDEKNYATLVNDDYIGSFNNLDKSIIRSDDEIEDELNQEYSLSYRKEFSSREHELKASIQFNDRSEKEQSDLREEISFDKLSYVANREQRSANDEGNQTILAKVDYVHPLGKDHKWETGLRSSIREIRNDYLVEERVDQDWVSIPNFSNQFLYDEQVHAGYFIYGNRFRKFSYQLGVRSEYTLINTELLESIGNTTNKRDTLNFFPSGHLSFHFSETNAVQFSYSRRINRPGFRNLNPFFTFTNDRNFYGGNPNINSEYTESFEIGSIKYWEGLSFSSSLFYRNTQSSIQRIVIYDNKDLLTLRLPLNMGTVDDYGLDASVSYSSIKWLRMDANINVFRNQLSLDQAEVVREVEEYFRDVRNITDFGSSFTDRYRYSVRETDNITWNGRLTARISFLNSDLQLRGNFRGPRESSQGKTNAVKFLDIGWTKDFLNRRMTATLSVRDVFNSRKRNSITQLQDFYEESEFRWRSRSTSLSLSYRINQKKKRQRSGGGRQNGNGSEEF